jgi:hypothetical protein
MEAPPQAEMLDARPSVRSRSRGAFELAAFVVGVGLDDFVGVGRRGER